MTGATKLSGEPVDRDITLADQFGADRARVEPPVLLCNPVAKKVAGVVTRIQEREVHLTCYDLHGPQRAEATPVPIFNQFERDIFPTV